MNEPIAHSAVADPRSAEAAQVEVGTAAETSDAEAAGGSTQSARILIADQQELSLELLQAFLAQAGYRHFIATTDSRRVLDLMRDERPDVVLLAAAMPDSSGLDILARVHADKTLRHTPILILTDSVDVDTKLKSLELGAADCLARPVDPSELLLRLRNTLAAKAHLDQYVYQDMLTGLPNRRRFTDQIDWSIRFAKRYGTSGAVLQIGLDRFKQVNEALGPALGDRLLRAVAQRLTGTLRESDVVAREVEQGQALLSRMGGDEFMVLLPTLPNADAATVVAQRILEVVSAPFVLSGRELFVTCCVGIAVFPNDGTNRDAILKAASVAMRHAKAQRRDSYRFFSKELNDKSLQRLSMENELRKAIEYGELELHYQPKVDLRSGLLCGAEALVRWRHPQRGVVSPGDFIPLAEESGLIIPLGQWVLRSACRQIREWYGAGLKAPRISINVSSHQVQHRDLARQLQSVLAETGVPASGLCIELTESAIMEQAKETVQVLDTLKAIGVTLSIDDFGTGYSSLSRLKRFPIDEVKIDRSFVTDVERDRDSAAIVTAVVAMGHSLDLRVVAEGVETRGQLDFLVRKGCDECQGYLFRRPLPAGDFGRLLKPDEFPPIGHDPAGPAG
jgi:diguanylate cyclase (GGDEF)-like protein